MLPRVVSLVLIVSLVDVALSCSFFVPWLISSQSKSEKPSLSIWPKRAVYDVPWTSCALLTMGYLVSCI